MLRTRTCNTGAVSQMPSSFFGIPLSGKVDFSLQVSKKASDWSQMLWWTRDLATTCNSSGTGFGLLLQTEQGVQEGVQEKDRIYLWRHYIHCCPGGWGTQMNGESVIYSELKCKLLLVADSLAMVLPGTFIRMLWQLSYRLASGGVGEVGELTALADTSHINWKPLPMTRRK